ncbi:MAG: hypothetical protein KH301_09065, partial [Brachyspira sp.]|nr:hypothetical protein [Brachyspira sp.]
HYRTINCARSANFSERVRSTIASKEVKSFAFHCINLVLQCHSGIALTVACFSFSVHFFFLLRNKKKK